MSARPQHFSKSQNDFDDAPVISGASDINFGLGRNTPFISSFHDHITDFLDQPSQIARLLSVEYDSIGDDEPEERQSLSPSSSLVAPLEGIIATPSSSDRSARRRLVSSRPTSRVARGLRQTDETFANSRANRKIAIATSDLSDLSREWFAWTLDSGQSPRTVELRKMQIARLLWFLQEAGYDVCGPKQMRHFFRHLIDGHKLPKGRWGCGADNRGYQELRPATLATYDRHFRSFFNFLVDSHFLSESPMGELPRQKDSSDQVEPYSVEHIKIYIKAAQASKFPKRNEAIIRFLLDTGVRASELCGLTMGRVDLFGRRARVLGKGNRNRIVSWGRQTGLVLRAYVRDEYFAGGNYKPDDPLFITAMGSNAGEAMSYTALRLLIAKLGKRGGIQVTRCSPHVFRHTFAIWFLRRGGEFSTLQMILGHNSPKATNIYVKYASADIENQQRMYSPGDALEL